MAKNLPLTTARCACPTCAECFNSVAAFEKHRVSLDYYGAPLPRGRRRCLDPLEMVGCGMVENSSGYRVTAPNPRFTEVQ